MSSVALRFTTRAAVCRRSFTSARVLSAGKESKLSDDARKDEIESAKQQQLKDQKEGKNTWKDDLASDSESVIKADRGELNKSAGETISQLQQESAKAAQREKDGK